VFERWCETTPWGQLFLRYAQHGPQGPTLEPRVDAGAPPLSESAH
jgi:hypothetical protein